MKTLALTAALGVAALLAGCNQKATTASPGAIDTQACCASKSNCADSSACSAKKAAGCPLAAAKAASAKTGASACCSSKKK